LEVRRKLQLLKCPWDEIDDVMVTLIGQDFLNEERFARAYARGKFNQKAWGKHKIRNGLREKGIGESLVEMVLSEEIPLEEYRACLIREIERRWGSDEEPGYEDRQLLRQHFIRRGYEWDLVDDVMKEIW
jgi:regulatory protein